MANTKSAIKRIKTSEKRHLRNQAVKSATRTYVKKARTAISRDAGEAKDEILAAISALDRAVKKGVIHRNNAARRKSRLMKRYNAALPSATPATEETAEEEVAPKKRTRSSGTKAAGKSTKTAAAKPSTKSTAKSTATKPAAAKTTRTRTKKTES